MTPRCNTRRRSFVAMNTPPQIELARHPPQSRRTRWPFARAARLAAGLGLALSVSASGVSAAPQDAAAQAFLADWRAAVARPGGDAIAALTAFPFLFESQPLARPAFVARVVPALFGPAARRCLQRAMPVAEDGRLVASCAPYGYVLAPTPEGWRLIEFFTETP
jgi:hypothetical protein